MAELDAIICERDVYGFMHLARTKDYPDTVNGALALSGVGRCSVTGNQPCHHFHFNLNRKGNMAKKYGFDFEIGDMVYLKTDMEQHSRIVTGINIRENGVLFCLMFTTTESWHYGFELTKERDVIKATS